MYTLNAEQARQLDRFQATEAYCIQNKNKYAMLKPFEKQVTLLAANNKKINSYVPARTANGKGATKVKKVLKADIATSVNDICSLVIPYALDIEDAGLYDAVNFAASDVTELRNIAVLGFVITLTGVIKPLLSKEDFADYPVTAADLDALISDASTYNNNISNNKMINAGSRIASGNIDALLADNRVILVKLGKLINYFEKKDPDFAKGYHGAAAVNNTGIHHSGSKGVVINSATDQPIDKVSVIITGKKNTKSTATNEEGAWQIDTFRPGKCKLTFSAPGFETQAVEVIIIRGKTLELNIALQSQVINISATA